MDGYTSYKTDLFFQVQHITSERELNIHVTPDNVSYFVFARMTPSTKIGWHHQYFILEKKKKAANNTHVSVTKTIIKNQGATSLLYQKRRERRSARPTLWTSLDLGKICNSGALPSPYFLILFGVFLKLQHRQQHRQRLEYNT